MNCLQRRLCAASFGFGLIAASNPLPSAAQWTGTTITVRVEKLGSPASGVEIAVVRARSARRVATTGVSGLAGIDLRGVDISVGERVATQVLECDGDLSVYFVPGSETMDAAPPQCTRQFAGTFHWGKTERVWLRIEGDRAWIETEQAEQFAQKLSGLRLTLDFLYDPLYGFEDGAGNSEYRPGYGGQARVAWLWSNGLGIGGGASVSVHDVLGIDENLTYWSVFLEPRYTFLMGVSKIRPHVLARVSYNWFDYGATPGGVPGGINQRGWGFGGGAGVHYPLLGWLGIEAGVYYGYLSMAFVGFEESRGGSVLELTAGVRLY